VVLRWGKCFYYVRQEHLLGRGWVEEQRVRVAGIPLAPLPTPARAGTGREHTATPRRRVPILYLL